MRLFIAEKPELARAIASVLDGDSKKEDGYIQKGNDIVIVVEDMDKDRIKINICLSEECYGNTVESKRSFVKDRTMNEYYK